MILTRRFFGRSALTTLVAAPALATEAARAGDGKPHRLAIHVESADASLMNVALSNIVNASEVYAERGEPVAIELVANGPGYAMLRADISPVKERLAEVRKQVPSVVFAACQKSRAAVAKAENKTIDQIPELPEATDIPSGVVRLCDLQEQGWSYIRV